MPPVKSTVKGALLLSEMLTPVRLLGTDSDAPRRTIALPDGTADLYAGSRPDMPGIVLVHGVAPGGPRDQRIVQIAAGLRRLGRTVLAPSLALGEQRLDRTDTARIRQAVDRLYDLTGAPVQVLAFSFGAGFSLVAFEERPDVQERVLRLTTVGTYFDLVHLLQGVTAGEVAAPGGSTDEWRPDPRAARMVTEFLAGFAPDADPERVLRAFDRRDPAALAAGERAIYELMTNSDPERTRALVAALPGGLGDAIADLSPAARIHRIRIPVDAMHSRQDPASPPSESALLVEALREPAQGRLTRVGSFRHVTPARGAGLLEDALPLLGFASRVIGAQERWGLYPLP